MLSVLLVLDRNNHKEAAICFAFPLYRFMSFSLLLLLLLLFLLVVAAIALPSVRERARVLPLLISMTTALAANQVIRLCASPAFAMQLAVFRDYFRRGMEKERKPPKKKREI